MTLSGSENIAAYIFAIFMLLVGGSVISYGEAIRNSGFTILYKIHEDENLLEREDEELIRDDIGEKEETEQNKEEADE